MTVATQERLDTSVRIHRNHPLRNEFAGKSTGRVYYQSKGCAVNTFDNVLQNYDLSFDRTDLPDFNGNDGWATLRIVNAYDVAVGYAHLSWYRMETGVYEFVGYIS